jgi:hypothetical protein
LECDICLDGYEPINTSVCDICEMGDWLRPGLRQAWRAKSRAQHRGTWREKPLRETLKGLSDPVATASPHPSSRPRSPATDPE